MKIEIFYFDYKPWFNSSLCFSTNFVKIANGRPKTVREPSPPPPPRRGDASSALPNDRKPFSDPTRPVGVTSERSRRHFKNTKLFAARKKSLKLSVDAVVPDSRTAERSRSRRETIVAFFFLFSARTHFRRRPDKNRRTAEKR